MAFADRLPLSAFNRNPTARRNRITQIDLMVSLDLVVNTAALHRDPPLTFAHRAEMHTQPGCLGYPC
jgi:hypothetical protein